MRGDSKGFFWQDATAKEKKKIELLTEEDWEEVYSGFWADKYLLQTNDPREVCLPVDIAYAQVRELTKGGVKCTPPTPVWLSPDYLPGLAEAKAMLVPLISDNDLTLYAADQYTSKGKHALIYDIECFGNFFMLGFRSVETGNVGYVELSDDMDLLVTKLVWIFQNFLMIGFNNNGYDKYIAALSLSGCSTAQMKAATAMIIEERMRGYQVLRHFKVKQHESDEIDLMEVAPLNGSLKIYAGRMHTSKMQDLPFPPNTVLTTDQRAIVRYYCLNDLRETHELFDAVQAPLALRTRMSQEYRLDLRSKSDAQIAEAVISSELTTINASRPQKTEIPEGTVFKFNRPDYMTFQTPMLNRTLNTVVGADYVLNEKGKIVLPDAVKNLNIVINKTKYKMGIGGLHSVDKKNAHKVGKDWVLKDVDVESYYPRIILNQGLFPTHLGSGFLTVYGRIVDRRLAAKARGDKDTSNSLKIVINGSFGKFGSKWSVLFAPQLLIQTTLSGQLSLLMMIEALELNGIQVVSANTDGIVIKCPKAHEPLADTICQQWESHTNFKLDETRYQSLYMRDVNNYIAVTTPETWTEEDELDDRCKTKGIFAKAGLSKNPQNAICITAVKVLLVHGTPIEDTIRACTDITQFVTVRNVKGGGVKTFGNDENGNEIPAEYLGKAVRWYFSTESKYPIVYAASGKKVPTSDGAQPVMQLPTTFPDNVDYEKYFKITEKILKQCGCY